MDELELSGTDPSPVKDSTIWSKCILCQDDSSQRGVLVLKPNVESFGRLIETIQERCNIQDSDYVQINKRLDGASAELLQERNAVWHRTCYSNLTNKDHIHWARVRYDQALSSGSHIDKGPGRKRKKSNVSVESSGSSTPFTRSSTEPYNKDLCFFCQSDDGKPVFCVRSDNAGKSLREAVEIGQNPVFMTRLNTAIDPSDAHAIDVMYHRSCWTTNVFHILRDHDAKEGKERASMAQVASLIEVINLVDYLTRQQTQLSMEEIETTYVNLLGGKDALEHHVPSFSRKWLKDRILQALPNLRSVLPKNRRKSAILYSLETYEEDMVNDITNDNTMDNMDVIYKAASLVRQSIENFTSKDQQEKQIQVSSSDRDVPGELKAMIHWIMLGPVEAMQTEARTSVADRSVLTVSQTIMYGLKSRRQVKYKPQSDSALFRTQRQRENPNVVGVGLAVHHDTRNKSMVDLLNALGYSVPYSRILLLETSIANAVVQNTTMFQGLYVPPMLKRGRLPVFGFDNTDFEEDTPDGKDTTHGTIVAVFQKSDGAGETIAPSLQISTEAKNLTVTPYHTDIIPCNKPKPIKGSRDEQSEFTISKTGVDKCYRLTHLGWLLAMVLSRTNTEGTLTKVPCWAGYNSLVPTRPLTVTQVGALPLLPEAAHEWSTLMTVLQQCCRMKELAVGKDHPTVVSCDLALYEKVVQLLDANPDLKGKIFPRLGELHVVMAALRGLGTSIENSGIDDAWTESDVYGSATTRQILKCTHYKRCLQAHIYSYVALYEMAVELFFQDNPHLKEICLLATEKVQTACGEQDKTLKVELVQHASNCLLQVIIDENLLQKFDEWEISRSKNAMFKAMMNYLHRVEVILHFIAASRNADVNLHLQAGEELSKIFFAMDRIKYKRLWPRYISDMHALKSSRPDTWRELEAGNISVTKNTIPFVSIGADHAVEHLNRSLKVHAGLIGISNNANARQRFFLAAAELSKMSSEFKGQFGIQDNEVREHHGLSPSVVKREHNAIDRIKAAILSHGNPFEVEGNQLFNVITNAYVPDEFVPQILNIDETGQKLYEQFVAERINGDVSLWASVKKEKNRMYMSGNTNLAVKIRDKTVDLKETKDLYGRLMVLCRSNRDVKHKDAIGNFEFTVTPRALFAPDGSLLSCTDKSKLIHALYQFANETLSLPEDELRPMTPVPTSDPANEGSTHVHPSKKLAVVDGMVVVQKMTKKAATVVTVKDFSECFNDRVLSLTRGFDHIILVFDTYKQDSLKSTTRSKRRHGKAPVQYQVKDDTSIAHITMSRFLSHEQTKADLADYLANKTLEYNHNSDKVIVVSASGCTSSNRGVQSESNNHEEADTLMIQMAIAASQQYKGDVELTIFSPDTDVLVLAVANYHLLPGNTSLSMASSVIKVEPICKALGEKRAQALPAFHAFTGADNTGRFARLGKAKWLQKYQKADADMVTAFYMLCKEAELSEDVFTSLARFVCSAYCPNGVNISNIPELRWHLFCKNMAENDRLPPTVGALRQHIMRVHIQAYVWGQAAVSHQTFLDPLKHGYHKDTCGQLKPTTTDVLPAPMAVIEMVRCQCKTDCSSQRCSCRGKNLTCTDLCMCSTSCENDEDSNFDRQDHDSDDDATNDE